LNERHRILVVGDFGERAQLIEQSFQAAQGGKA
jgi:hypothetical protein